MVEVVVVELSTHLQTVTCTFYEGSSADVIVHAAVRAKFVARQSGQAKELLAVPDRSTLKGKRDYVILALLVGCALRRNELAELDVETIQQREGRWVLADLEGKGRRIRTVAIPIWVKQGINAWMTAAGIEDGRLLRSISKSGKINRETLSDWAVWSIVEQSSKQIGIEHFGAHDLRRTCANVWSAALSQAKSEVTGWSAQMYSTFGGVCDSWPGWNALRPLPF
jgi:integrase